MNPIEIGLIVFVCVFSGALVGMYVQRMVPAAHLTPDAKDVVKLGMGLIATMTALVLGLVTASAKSAFDSQNGAIRDSAATILQMDRTLAQYGPETADIRAHVRTIVQRRLAMTWPEQTNSKAPMLLDTPDVTANVEWVAGQIQRLTPSDEAQRALQARALELATELQQVRWHILGGVGSSVQTPFLAIIVFWLSIIFASFGLFAPRNGTVIAVLLVCAFSVAASLFLILEMDDPFHGLMKVSSRPLRYTLDHLTQ